MPIDVKLPAPYVGLAVLVDVISEAVADATHGGSREERSRAAATHWEEELKRLAGLGDLHGYSWDSLERQDWAYLTFERDLFFIDDLSSCDELRQFAFVVSDDPDLGLEADLAELVYNDHPIAWRYWIEQLPKLFAQDAARLMSGLDPEVFVTLAETPNRNDARGVIAQAKRMERLADAEGKRTDTAEGWLAWAVEREFKVHVGYTLAVERLPPEGQRKRLITRHGGEAITTFLASQEMLDAESKKIAERQAEGYYTISEACADIAATNASINEVKLQRHMGEAAALGEIDRRERDTGGGRVPQSGGVVIIEGTLFHKDDINAWLEKKYRVEYRLASTAPTGAATPVARATAQEEAILRSLEQRGYTPAALPRRQGTKKWVKSEVWASLKTQRKTFGSDKVFDKAWERLRKDGRIAES
jgi:hypothetical protein